MDGSMRDNAINVNMILDPLYMILDPLYLDFLVVSSRRGMPGSRTQGGNDRA
jgi:hypothetical protein